MKSRAYTSFLLAALALSGSLNIFAQNKLQLPTESQKATLTQRIGVTDITIVYHRPLVNGRKIWGDVVPNNQVWRAGANENTTISLTHDASIEGNPLPAGIYGMHVIPAENEWTVIFSKNYTSWGSYSYKEKDDALRIKVKPSNTEFTESLTYEFADLKPNATSLALRWEKLKISFKVEVNNPTIILQNIRKELQSFAAPTWLDYYTSASFCYKNKINPEEALKWIDESIKIEEHFSNLQLKAKFLNENENGNEKEADEIMKKAFTVANENELNNYGYELMREKKVKEAIEIFKINVKAHPDNWNVYDSLAEGYEKDGDKKQALKNYNIALKKAPADQKQRLKIVLQKLEKPS